MSQSKIRLGINIDHIATIKTNRKTPCPSLIDAVKIAEESGADLITVHLREDRRHIQDQDLRDIKNVATKLNLEMALTEEMLAICLETKPDFCCIVPEKREELTTEGGLDIRSMKDKKFNFLKDAINKMIQNNISPSLFIDPDINQIDYALKSGVKCIELHTGAYADTTNSKQQAEELDKLTKAAEYASKNKIRVHAGHGLTYASAKILSKIKGIQEFNIGHFLVGESIFEGMPSIIKKFKRILKS